MGRDRRDSGVARFQKQIYNYFSEKARHFPWRRTIDPYKILVSEVMLQQTQARRVIPFYRLFVKKFPNSEVLAKASKKSVLSAWQGLGYNRRALYLRDAAREITRRHDGKVPALYSELTVLPGVGPYTAKALLAFSFNVLVTMLETNIRSVFIEFFFKNRKKVRDSEILPLVEKTLDTKNPRTWYWALMDYGAMLKAKGGNPSRKSVHHIRQSPFRGSQRELRGRLVKLFLAHRIVTVADCSRQTEFSPSKIRTALLALSQEGFVRKEGRYFRIGS